MKSNYTSIKFKQWLDKLQQESWQLELLISGFAIVALGSAIEFLRDKTSAAQAIESPAEFFYMMLSSFSMILIFNLIIHIVFRGLWIGSVGLRYVSGDIDYEVLNYSKKFTSYLEKKVGSFDKYISNLENICSTLFALTFIVLFYFLSFFFSFLIPFGLITILDKIIAIPDFIIKIIQGLLSIFIFFGLILTFIDFITQGYLKKKKWTSIIYFPVYRIFSILTLSFLYRHLVYNFLDNKFGKRLLFFLVPFYILVMVISSIENVQSNYIINNSYSSANFAKNRHYLNTYEKNDYVRDIAIESKVIDKSYLKIFIVFKSKIEDIIIEKNKDLQPQKDVRGINSRMFRSNYRSRRKLKLLDSLHTPYLKTFNEIYKVKVDTTSFKSDFIISKVNNQLGFETIIPLKDFSEGKHTLKVGRLEWSKKDKKEVLMKLIEIPFWYYKD
ncbi:hypothetical protein [uncultured Tenacibaculum sp.]|uniref:hypothetical protein n=1 Tax=uncultured Tenacibaculum sp. TaxID=174713 RepID=UPI0026227FC5|nr:hypothetical protein [uncultured Tenacibaculum sp.]